VETALRSLWSANLKLSLKDFSVEKNGLLFEITLQAAGAVKLSSSSH